MPDEQSNQAAADEGVVLGSDSFAAFAGVMDQLAPEADGADAGASAEASAAGGAGEGSPAAPAEGAGAAADAAAAPAGGDAAESAAQAEPAAVPGDSPWTATGVDAASVASEWTKLTEGVETSLRKQLEVSAVESVREEFASYVDAVGKPAALLKGLEVPKIGGADGETVVLRDSQEAAEWQETVKYELAQEIRDRASRLFDEQKPATETFHQSIELLSKNADLVPGTKQFDKELATAFSKFAKPYEKRNDAGKLIGYTIPVQGIVDNLRSDIQAKRTAAPAAAAAPAGPTAQQQRAAEQARNTAGQFTPPAGEPQVGVTSQAGQSSDDGGAFDTLFATLGIAPGTIRI